MLNPLQNWLETLAFIIPTAYLPIMFKFIPFINDAQKWMFKLTTDIMKVGGQATQQ